MTSFGKTLSLIWICVAVGRAANICTVATTGLAFGSYNPIQGHESDITGTVIVTCMGTVGDVINYELSIGTGRGSFHNRQMTAGSQTLHYNIFTDPSRSVVWGDGTQGTNTVTGVLHLTAPMVSKLHVVYGRVMGNQRQLTAQSYWDNLVVSVKF